MKLATLLREVETEFVNGSAELDIQSIAYDSRKVEPGALFIALPGEKADGAQFIPQAVAAGAIAVVAEKDVPLPGVTVIVVKNARKAMGDLSAAKFEHPTRHMKIAGVTGTNGKTTTSYLIKNICEKTLRLCGLVGTVRYEIGPRSIPAWRTTPEAPDLQDLLWQMRSAGCRAAVMEVASHALVQERVRGVEFDVAVFTNLTQDHLDYHKTMEAYFEAKTLLFTNAAGQKKKKAQAVINVDDRYGSLLIAQCKERLPIITYGMGQRADFRASNVRTDFQGTSFQLDANGRSYLVRLPLIGNFNVYNALAAIAAASVMGVDVRVAVLALATAPAVPGRLEAVPAQRNFRVFVDYAHTDDALINAMKTLRELKPARLLVVFGCGGNRDRGKRPRMGAAVDEHADYAIVTSDNPRKEDPLAIIDDIKPGMPRGNYEVIEDRRAAIQRAIDLAQARDIVLIAGKGHEAYQEFADRTIDFDDVAVAKQALQNKPVDLNR
jgi:UDP-N-acetylmuramoyl-L-alanyl-D-glutamate--2,6-diaminopimelate ligase